MLNYHFTNDIRFENLEKNLEAMSKHLKTGSWNHEQTLDQAKNGWYPAYQLYFGLDRDLQNVDTILAGNVLDVITEFVKKFQFPNSRVIKAQNVMKLQIDNSQLIAPLRELVKLLLYKMLVEKTAVSSIEVEEFERYILLNDTVAKNRSDVSQVYTQLKGKVLAGEPIEYNYFGGDKTRFVKQLVGILEKLPFIEKKGNLIILDLLQCNEKHKAMLMDIVTYNSYWSPGTDNPTENIGSYKQHMQVNNQEEMYVRETTEVIQIDGIEDDSISQKFTLDDTYNLITYGAPGTGKSYSMTSKIRINYPNFEDVSSDDSLNVFRTTLHPEYTYSDFVGQIMPTITDNGPTYKFIPGVFTLALKRAISLKDDSQPVYLVLEELSRANVAAVFGDLFQLLDRKSDGISEYTISNPLIAKYVYNLSDEDIDSGRVNTKIYLPENLYIYATVNTNDQNVFVMDTAFKRRFEWQYVSTKPVNEVNNPMIKICNFEGVVGKISWHKFYQKLNSYITEELKLGEDKQVGQFFIQFSIDEARNKEKIQNKLLQYLWDDVERASFNSKKLFNNSISSYADLYEKYEEGNTIFSSDFLMLLNEDIEC